MVDAVHSLRKGFAFKIEIPICDHMGFNRNVMIDQIWQFDIGSPISQPLGSQTQLRPKSPCRASCTTLLILSIASHDTPLSLDHRPPAKISYC